MPPGLAFSLVMPRILSPHTTHASGGGVIIYVRQGLFFSELSTYSISSLDPYSDDVGVNISPNNYSLSFLNAYAPPIRSSLIDNRTDSFSPSILSSSRKLHSEGIQLPSLTLRLKKYFRLFDWAPVGKKYLIGHLL